MYESYETTPKDPSIPIEHGAEVSTRNQSENENDRNGGPLLTEVAPMNDEEFRFLVQIAKLPYAERKRAIGKASDALGLIAQEVLQLLLGNGNQGTAATAWLAAVLREAHSRKT